VLVVAAVVVVVLALSGGKNSSASAQEWPPDSEMTGLLTTPPPWPSNAEQLPGRLETLGLDQLAVEGNVIHIHQHLDLFVNGKHVAVPASVGFPQDQSFIAALHTHDGRGVIHVESPEKRDFYLGEFFGVWGVRLNEKCIGGDCARGTKQLRAYVNGEEFKGDPRDIVLKPHEEIVLAFGTRKQLPKEIPSSYKFAEGE
jgi:hypothetical protein